MLTALLNGATINPEFQPQNNKQAYLAYLCGLDIVLPEPRTAEETLLYNLCVNGGVSGGSFEITNCNYLFYNGARKDVMEELFKRIPYISNANNMFATYDDDTITDLFDILPSDFIAKLQKSTDCQSMFYNANALKSFPDIEFENEVATGYMFNYATHLVSVGNIYIPSVGLNGLQSMFQYTSRLESVGDIKVGDETAVKCGNMFDGAKVLKSVGTLGFKPSNASSMFNGCYALEKAPALDLTECTSIRSMFSNCNSLKGTVNLGKTAVENDVVYAFQNCYELEGIVDFYVNTTGTVPGSKCFPCGTSSRRAALKRLTFHPETNFTGFSYIDLSYCSFERAGMVEFFNSLPSVADSDVTNVYKTITIKENPCVVGGTVQVDAAMYEFSSYEELEAKIVNNDLEDTVCVLEEEGTAYNMTGRELLDYLVEAEYDFGKPVTVGIPNHEETYETLTDEDRAIATDKGWILVEA